MHPLHAITITYLTDIRKQRAQPQSTNELSYRGYLSNFLRAAAGALGKVAEWTDEGQKITYGRPDYTVAHGLKVIGYAEAEALGADLAQLKGHAKEQNDRFRTNLHNFLQTNHFDFRLFVAKELSASASLPVPSETGPITVSDAALDALQRLLETFLDGATPAAVTAEDLARQLARRAAFLRDAADVMLAQSDSPLHPYWNLYKDTLFADIDKDKFADVYAQTFAYGLFLAWLNTTQTPFDRATALHALPRAVPPIRVLLTFAGGDELPPAFAWIVDGICADLDAATKSTATQHTAGIQDPLIHFYEPFLAAYDPQLRERAGVYYTPDPVVDFLVRAVDDLLKRDFGKASGLADDSVRLLDPATGTATFLARAYRQVHQAMQDAGDGGLWPDRARDHVAKHFYGFERLPAAYTLAHVKLRQQLAEMGVPLTDEDRLPVYLADTMMNKVPAQMSLPGANLLSKEIRDAAEVRDQEQILVVIGNPPYFGKSDNPSKDSLGHPTFIGDLIQTYYKVDGVPLGEKNPKWLQNDYVKFIRFAQWRVERSGQGIVAFITDNSYLDNPTFRGMRRSLMQTFDEICILDLHGNSNKKERSPDGFEDQNVFDIKQGVAICLLIKRPPSKVVGEAVVRHAEFYGTRSQKYARLLSSNAAHISDTSWTNLAPNPPFYLFMPQGQAFRQEYEMGWAINKIFLMNNMGVTTGDAERFVSFAPEELEARLDAPEQKYVTTMSYRCFDTRAVDYNPAKLARARFDFMQHLRYQENRTLATVRRPRNGNTDNFFVSNRITGKEFISSLDNAQLFPLWRYPTGQEAAMGIERQANIAPNFLTELSARLGETPAPEDVFHYAYAVFHAPTYRTRYAAFLKTDFPRLPLPPDAETFRALAALGAKLTALHLLEDPALAQHGISFPVVGGHVVKKMRAADRYVLPTPGGQPGRVRLNDAEYFENVPPEAWAFQVGGYQPAFKWLDDRKERALTEEDITHYRKMIAAMRETAALLPQVDAAFATLLAGNAHPTEDD